MKKNSEYIGVDEKFIPENEKYVDDGLLGNKEQSKNTVKKAIKVGLGAYLLIVIIMLVFIGVVFFGAFKIIGGVTNTFDKMQGNTLDDMQGVVNNMMDLNNKTDFNFDFEGYSGTQTGLKIRSLLDKVVTSNKKNKNNIIIVTYKETVTTSEDEIVNIKYLLDKSTEYEVSLDYDANGYINKVTIKDILGNITGPANTIENQLNNMGNVQNILDGFISD